MKTYKAADAKAQTLADQLDRMDTAKAEGRTYPQAEYKSLEAEYKTAEETANRLQKDLRSMIGDHTALTYDMYRLANGEVEARDTEARRGMSADMRRVTPPGSHERIPVEEQIAQSEPKSTAFERAVKQSVSRSKSQDRTEARKLKNTPEARAKRTVVDKAGEWVGVSAEDLTKKGNVWLASTKDLARMVTKTIPSAQKLVDLHSRGHALARDFQKRLLAIKDSYHELPSALKGVGAGTLSEFLHDSTIEGKWGFKPDYHAAAVVDPAMAKRFNALPAEAQKVIKDVFRFNHDSRAQLHAAVQGAINAEYDPQIMAARTPADKTSLMEAKGRALAQTSRVFDTQEALPYTPLKREGRWAVVAKSKEYRAAEKAGDQKALDKMANDPAHHVVDFRDSVYAAKSLRDNLATKFGPEGAYHFEREKVAEGAVTTGEMHLAFSQLKAAIGAEAGKGSKLAQRLDRLATDLYLHTLSENSARKGELGRRGISSKDPVTGETMDMMRAFVSRGNATANYIASIANTPEIQKTLTAMRNEVSKVENPDERTTAQRIHNDIMWRYATNLGNRANRPVDKFVHGLSIWNLLSSPFHYAQNATQHVLISQPIMAARFGYRRVAAETATAYRDFGAMAKDVKLGERIDFDTAPKDVRGLLHYLGDHGNLDAGYSGDMAHWEQTGDGLLPQSWNRVDSFLRNAPQRVEQMNRIVTGIATFRAALKSGMSEAEAMKAASKMIDDTHGDYSGFNTPHAIAWAGDAGKVIFQFRKFQLIMGGLVGKEFHRAFKGSTAAEKIQGVKALAFLSAHLAAVGGIMGLPGLAGGLSLMQPVMQAVSGLVTGQKDDKWEDWQTALREGLGAGGEKDKQNWLADFLYKGAPYALLGADVSDRLGMGNIFALAPYTDIPKSLTSREKFDAALWQAASGPSGGLLNNIRDGWGFGMEQHDWERMVEAVAPVGLRNSMMALRYKSQGLTDSHGDVLVRPEDISTVDAFKTALGVRPRELVNVAERRSAEFDATEHYKALSTQLTRQYNRAAKDKDTAEMADIRGQWQKMNEARVEQKFRPEPLSTLLKGPMRQMKTERGVIGGVATDRQNRMFVAQLMMADTPEEARDLMEARAP